MKTKRKIKVDDIITDTVVRAGQAPLGAVLCDKNIELDRILSHAKGTSETMKKIGPYHQDNVVVNSNISRPKTAILHKTARG